MLRIDCDYPVKDDISFLMEAEKINILEFSERTKVSRTTLETILKNGKARNDVCEKIYAYAYRNRYRLNAVKEELRKEYYGNILFHGSRDGLNEITANGSRENCDFGKGFYLGETYNQAVSFVCEKENSSVYSFRYSLDGLKIKRFDCDLEWMLAICSFRGRLKEFSSSQMILPILQEAENADVIIAPIADNKNVLYHDAIHRRRNQCRCCTSFINRVQTRPSVYF